MKLSPEMTKLCETLKKLPKNVMLKIPTKVEPITVVERQVKGLIISCVYEDKSNMDTVIKWIHTRGKKVPIDIYRVLGIIEKNIPSRSKESQLAIRERLKRFRELLRQV